MTKTTSPSFSLGAKPYSKIEAKQKRRKRNLLPQSTESVFHQPTVRLIPCTQSLAFSIDMLKGTTYIQKLASLQAMKPPIYICSFWKETSSLSSVAETLATMKKESRAYLQKNQVLRWRLKRFLTRWRLQHLRQLNDVDPITLSPIQEPICIISFGIRAKHSFEASSLLQEIHQKLLRCNGQIPTPVFPRNPLTNEDLTYGQLLSVYNQCLKYGKMKWAFQGFFHARFSIPLFLTLHRKSLRINAIKATLNTHDSYDGMDMLLDFIEKEHEEHEMPCNTFIYRWCLYHLPNEKRIVSWRNLCRAWYEKDILLDEKIEKEIQFNRIHQQSILFCNPPYDLLAKRQFLLTKKKESHNG